MAESNHQEMLKKTQEQAKVLYLIVTGTLPKEEKLELITKHQKIVNKMTQEIGKCDCVVEEGKVPSMTVDEALNVIGDGHTVYWPQVAKVVCEALGVPYKPELLRHYWSDWTAYKGYQTTPDQEGALGVHSLELSDYIVSSLGLPHRSFRGRGFQAQANRQDVEEHLKKVKATSVCAVTEPPPGGSV